jgi:hypothetical protein
MHELTEPDAGLAPSVEDILTLDPAAMQAARRRLLQERDATDFPAPAARIDPAETRRAVLDKLFGPDRPRRLPSRKGADYDITYRPVSDPNAGRCPGPGGCFPDESCPYRSDDCASR